MTEPTIVCPSCRTEIKLSESLTAPLIESTRRQCERQMGEKDKTLPDLHTKLRDTPRKAEQGSPQLQGGMQELDLEDMRAESADDRWHYILGDSTALASAPPSERSGYFASRRSGGCRQ